MNRIYESTQSGEQRSHISKLNTCHIVKQVQRCVFSPIIPRFFSPFAPLSPLPYYEPSCPPSTRWVIEADNQWEILGDLALRLQHKEEAKDAFQRCLDSKFSAKALLKLLEMYSAEGDLQRTLNIAIRLTTYHHRYVPLYSFPSFFSLIPTASLTLVLGYKRLTLMVDGTWMLHIPRW